MFFLNHPKSLWVLAFGKLWDTFSYFGTQTILALYFIHIFHLDRSTSYLLYGAYAAWAFSIPILGGIVGDRWLGSKHSLVAGFIINIIGNLLMVSLNRYWFCLGLATSLIGSGLYKSNSTHIVGTLYGDDNIHKESGFTCFYLAMNVGGTLGPLFYGLVAYSLGWNYIFLCSASGILIGGLWFIKNWNLFHNEYRAINLSGNSIGLLCISMIIACILLSLTFYFPSIINPVICLTFILSIFYILIAIKQFSGKKRRHLVVVFLLCFLSLFYFAAGLQTGITVTLFIQHKIQEGMLKTQLPGSTFNMLYCLFVVLLAPCFTYLFTKLNAKGITFNAFSKLAMGIGFATLGIATFAVSTTTSIILPFIVIGYLFLSAGELVITPAAYTAISNLSPMGMKSTMMGCWLLFIAIGGYFSSILANFSHIISEQIPFGNIYSGVFLIIAIFTFTITIIITALLPRLLKMMA